MDEIKRQLDASNGTQVVIYVTDLSNIIEDVFDELMKHKDTLTILKLVQCNLRYMPNTIGNLTQLIRFDCDHNQLESLPDTIGNLTQLTKFYCSYNQLEFLPDWIGNLTQLTEFSCSNNQLEFLPDTIGNLTQLTHFFCDQNQLEYLPISIRFLEKIKYFYCDIDKIQNLDKDVYQKGGSAVIEWMQENYNPMVKSTHKN